MMDDEKFRGRVVNNVDRQSAHVLHSGRVTLTDQQDL